MKSIESLKIKTDLRTLSHLKVGKVSDVFFPKNYHDLQSIYLNFKSEKKFPIGGGSNLLFSDKSDKILISDKYLPKKIEIDQNSIRVSANYNINEFIMKMAENNLGGLEFLAGIPAHLGGLIFMNAGAYNKNISQFIESILVITNSGEKKLIMKDEIDFKYRNSNIDGFILEVGLKLIRNERKYIDDNIQDFINRRRVSQPLSKPNIGCFFKNPGNLSAGKLIDELGLKGVSVGDACISDKHANFIINKGNASFQDIICLTEIIKKKVIEHFNINFDMEIRIV